MTEQELIEECEKIDLEVKKVKLICENVERDYADVRDGNLEINCDLETMTLLVYGDGIRSAAFNLRDRLDANEIEATVYYNCERIGR